MFVLLYSLCIISIQCIFDADYTSGSLQSGRKSKCHQFKMIINTVHITFPKPKVYVENTATNYRS